MNKVLFTYLINILCTLDLPLLNSIYSQGLMKLDTTSDIECNLYPKLNCSVCEAYNGIKFTNFLLISGIIINLPLSLMPLNFAISLIQREASVSLG